jgi:hypothetical protein
LNLIKICIERAFFVLDTQTGVIHIFKTLNQDKPSESFSISKGTFPEKLSKYTILFNEISDYIDLIIMIRNRVRPRKWKSTGLL